MMNDKQKLDQILQIRKLRANLQERQVHVDRNRADKARSDFDFARGDYSNTQIERKTFKLNSRNKVIKTAVDGSLIVELQLKAMQLLEKERGAHENLIDKNDAKDQAFGTLLLSELKLRELQKEELKIEEFIQDTNGNLE